MNIRNFAIKHGLSTDTLRFYEKCKILIPCRLANRYRSYTDIHEQKVRLIIALKSIGFSLEEIKQLTELDTKAPSEECNLLSNKLIDKKIEMISKKIDLLEYGKSTLYDVKKYIDDNSFIQNQEKIRNMIDNLYTFTKNTNT